MWTNQIKTSVLAIQRTQSGNTHRIEEIIWQSASSTVRVFIRQGDRYTLSRMELLISRKKQIRHGDQVSNKTINALAESKQHCEGVQKAGGQVLDHSVQDSASRKKLIRQGDHVFQRGSFVKSQFLSTDNGKLGQAGCIFSSKVIIELSLCQISQVLFLLVLL